MFFNAAKVMVCLVSAVLTGKSHTLILAAIVHKYTYQGLQGKALPAQVQFDALKLGVYFYYLQLQGGIGSYQKQKSQSQTGF